MRKIMVDDAEVVQLEAVEHVVIVRKKVMAVPRVRLSSR
jgi:hypothetical protein